MDDGASQKSCYNVVVRQKEVFKSTWYTSSDGETGLFDEFMIYYTKCGREVRFE